MTNEKQFLSDLHPVNKRISMGNNSREKVSIAGSIKLLTKNENNEPIFFTLNDICYIPNLSCNLVSLTKAMVQGLTWVGSNRKITIFKDEIMVKCDVVYPTYDSFLIGAYTTPILPNNDSSFLTFDTFHRQLGHPGFSAVRRTAKNEMVILNDDTSEINTCEDCATASAHRLPLLQYNSNPCQNCGERIYVDT